MAGGVWEDGEGGSCGLVWSLHDQGQGHNWPCRVWGAPSPHFLLKTETFR